MILFFDDDKPQAPATGRRKYIRRSIKALVILMVLLCISLWVLSSLGGNSKPLKLGMQDYLTDVTGYIAQVETLEDMRFFPMSHISFQGLSLHKMIEKQSVSEEGEEKKSADSAPDEKGNSQFFPYQKTAADFFDAGAEVLRLGSLNITLGFWDVFFSRRRFYEFDLAGLVVDKGIWGLQALSLNRLTLDNTGQPAFVGGGVYGGKPFSLRVEIQKDQDGAGRARYNIPDDAPVEFSWGDISLKAVLGTAMGKGISLRLEELRIGQQNFSGNLTWDAGFKGVTLTGHLKTDGVELIFSALTSNEGKTTGTLNIPVLDVNRLSLLQHSYDYILDLLGVEKEVFIFSGDQPVMLDVKIADIQRQEKSLGHMTAQVKIEKGVLEISRMTGLLGGGALTGDLKFEGREQKITMTAAGKLRGWDYVQHEGKTTAQLDIYANLQSQAVSWGHLVAGLTGEMIIVAESADLVPADMLYQTGPALSLLRGSHDDKQAWPMSCGFMDLEIENGRATLQRGYLEGADRLIEVSGGWDWQTGKVDLRLMPYLKDESVASKLYPVTIMGFYPSWQIKAAGSAQSKVIRNIKQDIADFSLIKPEALALSPRHPCQTYLGSAQP